MSNRTLNTYQAACCLALRLLYSPPYDGYGGRAANVRHRYSLSLSPSSPTFPPLPRRFYHSRWRMCIAKRTSSCAYAILEPRMSPTESFRHLTQQSFIFDLVSCRKSPTLRTVKVFVYTEEQNQINPISPQTNKPTTFSPYVGLFPPPEQQCSCHLSLSPSFQHLALLMLMILYFYINIYLRHELHLFTVSCNVHAPPIRQVPYVGNIDSLHFVSSNSSSIM